ncbi:hypothetical protein HN51_049086 [Arachis hypogaea]
MYGLSAYFLARIISDLALDLILPVLFLLVVYFLAGLRLNATPFSSALWRLRYGLGLAIGATLMDMKRATALASVTVMTFMLAGGFFVQVQYEQLTPVVNGIKIDSGLTEVAALIAMVFGYRFLAYLSLRRMKLQSGA